MNVKCTAFLLFLFISPNSGASETLSQILEKHGQTIGSLDAWNQLQSLTFKLEIKEPNFEVEGIYRISRKGKMRIDIFSNGEQVFTEAYNGKTGWQWQRDMAQAKIIDGVKAAALRHGIEMPGHLFTLLDMQAQGHRLEYLGDETRDNVQAHVLLLTLKDGHKKYYIIDVETGVMLANRDQRAFHPDIDQTEVMVETRPGHFKEAAGVVRSFRSENYDLTNDQWLGTTKIVDMRINPIIDDSYFESTNTEAELIVGSP